ncbi:MAG: Trk system potassium transporter TrkA, partial [Clostridia bacterium]|nr:Trk system potassium transporter TrkA [Clostridia bacterium]
AIQFNVEGHTAFVGKAVKEIKIKSGILISAIIREKSLIIPNGDTKIFDGDSMIIVYKSDKIVSSIDDILR